MQLSTAILFIGIILFGALMLVQFRWTEAPPEQFRHRREWLAVATIGLFLLTAGLHAFAVEAERPPDPPCCLTTFSEPEQDPNRPPPPPPRP
jgi:hypothetical protein